jgi:hypothetical protein
MIIGIREVRMPIGGSANVPPADYCRRTIESGTPNPRFAVRLATLVFFSRFTIDARE